MKNVWQKDPILSVSKINLILQLNYRITVNDKTIPRKLR